MIKNITLRLLFVITMPLLGVGAASAQGILPGIFGAGSGAAQAVPDATSLMQQLQQAQQQQQVQVPGVQVPVTGVTAPSVTISPPASRDQLVVVAPAPAGRMFGSQLFGGTFRGTINPGFNPDYVITVGDRINVRLWGAFNFEGSLVVDPQGNVFIPNVGPIAVAGIKSSQLNPAMERGIRKTFKSNTDIYAALDASQPVKVYVTGFVRQPGLYGGLASDSPISYLDKAGGVDQDRGSYIDVVVKRGTQVRKRVNLYSFLLEGLLDIVQFQDGDVIVVGPRQHTFTVGGEVFNAYDFEFSEAGIPLTKALDMAKPKPGSTHISIIRRQGSEKRTEYFPLSEVARLQLQDGDAANVTADRYQGTIQVRVEGAHSGEHAIVLPYGATLKDVMAQIKPNIMSRVEVIQLFRKSVQARQKEMLAVALRKIEEMALSARSKTSEEANLRRTEADLLMKFVERAKLVEPKGQVVLDSSQRDTTLLEDGDVIVIPERTSLVMVHGEVLFPNAVSWGDGKSAEDYIDSAGGYTQSADTSKVVVISQNGATRLADGQSGFFQSGNRPIIQAGDEVIVLPRIESKSIEVTRAITQILYHMAFTAGVAFNL